MPDSYPPSSDQRLLPTLTGHEEPSVIVTTALAVAGPPLGRFMTKTMGLAKQRSPGRYRNWSSFRKRKRRDNGGRLSPNDTRRLMGELDYHWDYLLPLMPDSPHKDETARRLRSLLRDTTVRDNMHAAQHQDQAPLTRDAARDVLVALRCALSVIGAHREANYMAPLITRMQVASEAAHRADVRPSPQWADDSTVAIGVHWMQPTMGIPSLWWWVAVKNQRVVEVDVDLATAEVYRRLQGLSEPALAGLAFCFSAPAHYVRRSDIESADGLWSRAISFTHRDATTAVTELGAPFRLIEPGSQMRQINTDASAFRETEVSTWQRTGVTPSSLFDIDGTDSVGALALNGMPLLRDLRSGGAAIWPFDPPQRDGLTCVEIFPRSLWATVNPTEDPKSKKHPDRRTAFVEQARDQGLSINQRYASIMAEHERAFDALVTAWSLARFGGILDSLPTLERADTEGQIWLPE